MIWLQAAVLALAATGDGEPVLLDFTAIWCQPCQQMAPTVDRLAAAGCRVQKVDFDRGRALANRYGVSKIPCFIVLSGDREIGRVVGVTSYGRLLGLYRRAEKISKEAARSRRSVGEQPPIMPMRSASGKAGASMSGASAPSEVTHAGWESRPNITQPNITQPNITPVVPLGSVLARNGPANSSPVNSSPENSGVVSEAHLIAASVRIRVQDPKGQSCGTGTIIDARQGWALILTCGHIFRDSQGRGPIAVDLFGSGGPQQATAELVSYDIERDIGLLRIQTTGPVAVARVAPVTRRIAIGDPVINVGCNNGNAPTARRSRISSKNKYLGPPNLQADGMPVEGRSGGGLFSTDGFVIGVCNCADPKDNEGLYAAGDVIRAELDRASASFVYQDQPGGLNSNPGDRLQQTTVHESLPVQARPLSVQARPLPVQARPLPVQARPLPAQTAMSLAESATLEELMRRQVDGAEIVCVVNSRANPASRSRSIALDRSSPSFLNQMASELGTATAEVVSIIRSPANPDAKSEIIVLNKASSAFLSRLATEIAAAQGVAMTGR